MGTRREFLTQALWAGGATMAFNARAFAAFGLSAASVIEPVQAACKRLAAAGWRDLLMKASGGALDIGPDRREARLPRDVRSRVLRLGRRAAPGDPDAAARGLAV